MRRFKLKNLALTICIIFGGIVGTGSSYAAILSAGSTTNDALGIDGVSVDGVIYNVTFTNASYITAYGSTPPTFLGSGANDAASALASALNNLGVTGLVGISGESSPTYTAILVPTLDFGNGYEENYAAFCPALDNNCQGPMPWMSGIYGSANVSTVYANSDFAVFATTPVPPALPLFATGLGSLGLLGWRKKRKLAKRPPMTPKQTRSIRNKMVAQQRKVGENQSHQ